MDDDVVGPVAREPVARVDDAVGRQSSSRRARDEVEVSVSRETAEWLARIVAAKVRGQEIVLTRFNAEVTPTEAAGLLGMSRPQVRKLMDEGKLAFRKVGTHHRIKVSSIRVKPSQHWPWATDESTIAALRRANATKTADLMAALLDRP